MAAPYLRQFVYEDKFKMSFDNVLIFTGHFTDSSNDNTVGKNLYIPLSQNHPAYTLKITRSSFSEGKDVRSLIIDFPSPEEREIVENCDFKNEIFYVGP